MLDYYYFWSPLCTEVNCMGHTAFLVLFFFVHLHTLDKWLTLLCQVCFPLCLSKCHPKHSFLFCHFTHFRFTVPKVATLVISSQVVCAYVCQPFWWFFHLYCSHLFVYQIVFILSANLSTPLAFDCTFFSCWHCTFHRQLTLVFSIALYSFFCVFW